MHQLKITQTIKQKLILLLILTATISCNKTKGTPVENILSTETLESTTDSIPETAGSEWDINTIPSSIEGYAPSSVVGNWMGDGIKDTMYTCFFSRKLNREVVSPLVLYGDEIEYDELVGRAVELDPVIYIINRNRAMDTITIDGTNQLFGLYFLENKGDLDGDGKDELLYMVDFADWSSTNTYHIASHKENKWIKLYNFPVWEWQFEEDDNNVIKKLPDHKIQITFRNDESMEETKIVDLSKIQLDKS